MKYNLSPRPSLKGREPVAQGVNISPLGETGEGFLSALMPSVLGKAFKGEL